MGMPDTAVRTAAIAVDSARRTKHHLSLNNALSYVTAVYFWNGDFDACERHLAMLEENVARHGLVARRPVWLFYTAALAYTRNGASRCAIEALQRAIVEFRNINHLARMPYYLSVLADALAHGGRMDEAEATIRTALEIAQTHKELWCVTEVMRVQARIATLRGRADEAADILLAAMARGAQVGTLGWRLRAALDLARLRPYGAAQILGPVVAAFGEGHATRDLRIAADLIAAHAPR
jgi:tetratricopeptide (TPR) repeat protein